MKISYKKGFTLLELLVVIAIIGIISSIVIVATAGPRARANNAKRVAEIREVMKGLELYYATCDSYPMNVNNYNRLGTQLGSSPLMNSLGLNSTNGCGNNQGSVNVGNGGFGNSSQGINGEIYIKTINQAPTPVEASFDSSNSCSFNNSFWGEAIWNDYVYLGTNATGKRFTVAPSSNKAASYRLYFCLSRNTGSMSAGRYMVTPTGILRCTDVYPNDSACGIPID